MGCRMLVNLGIWLKNGCNFCISATIDWLFGMVSKSLRNWPFIAFFLTKFLPKSLNFKKIHALFGKKCVELAIFCKNLKKFPYFCLNFGMVTKSLKNWPFLAFFLIKFLPKSLNFKNFARFLAKSL